VGLDFLDFLYAEEGMRRRLLILFVLSVLDWSGTVLAAPLKFCFEDVQQRPWTSADGTGLNFVLLKIVERKLGEHFEMTALPWKRCLAYVANGAMDGVISAGVSPERRDFGVFPTLPNGQERAEARLYSDDFNIYVRIGSQIKWDGKQFANLHGVVASQAGYLVGGLLRKLGVEVDESGKSAEHGLRLLVGGSVDAAVLEGREAITLIRTDPRFQKKVEMLPLPFESPSLYLLIGKKRYLEKPKRIEDIWRAIETERIADEYLKQEKAALAKP
jgi:polar amino acid transport system substrate-binding protein